METPYQHAQIENNFSFHPATRETGPKHDRVRRLCRVFAHELANEVPPTREREQALAKLEEVMMWANAAIARDAGLVSEALGGISTPQTRADFVNETPERR